jgi:aminopeptidase N
MRQLVAAARSLARGKAPSFDRRFLEITRAIAVDGSLDPAYRALALNLPGETEIAQTIGRNVDPDSIFRARSALMAEMGAAIEQDREALMAGLDLGGPYDPGAAAAGIRAFANTLLTLGVVANMPDAEDMSSRQFEIAGNMNDRFAAFTRILHWHASRKASAMAISAFAARHGRDPLVMDKWFHVQATIPGRDSVSRIRALMKHPLFSLRNPNRVRSVIGAFATGNQTGFHAVGGEGYRFVADAIRRLDALNPQIAARMLTAFRSYRSLEPQRRRHAEEALLALKGGGRLSRDASDILDRMLART